MNSATRVRTAAGLTIAAVLLALWLALPTSLFISLTVSGITTGAIYALSGLGLVITFRASGVFNFGHGAIAMFVAYTLWQQVQWGIPVLIAGAISIVVVGPGIGFALERAVFRPLSSRRAGTAEQLIATVGVFILLVGLAVAIWGPETKTDPPALFGTRPLDLPGGVTVSVDQLSIAAVVIAVSFIIYWLFEHTRTGLRLRAVVEHRELAQLTAVDANRVSAIAWGIGAGLAGLTGILFAPATFGLDPYHFTLLVAETFAVAVIARLESLWLAVAGGILLGLAMSYTSALHPADLLQSAGFAAHTAAAVEQWVRPVIASLPVVALFAALFVHRNFPSGDSETPGLARDTRGTSMQVRLARYALDTGIVIALLVAPFVLDDQLMRPMHDFIALTIVFISIVIVTGYGGRITLGQAAFAGVGAFLTGRLVAGSMFGLPAMPVILATIVAGILGLGIGALVGLPALRRRGLLLGLTTFAVGLVLERFVFANYQLTGGSDTLEIHRPGLFGLSLASDTAFHYYELIVLAAVVVIAWLLRSGRIGRALTAMRDAEMGARAVGVRPRRYTMLLFVVSTGLAAVGGSLLAQSAETFSRTTFRTFDSLIWFAAVVVAGASSIHGALLAAFALTVLSKVAGDTGVTTLLIGIGALVIGRLPGGIVAATRRFVDLPPAPASHPSPSLRPSRIALDLLGRGRTQGGGS